MTSIEKITFKSQTVIVVISCFSTALASYYSNKTAIHDGFNEVKIEIQDLRNEDKLIKKDISELEKRADKIETAAFTYLNKTTK